MQAYVPPPRPLTVQQVVNLAYRHGLDVGNTEGYTASLRRHLASSMQAPGAKTPSQYYVTPYLKNVPLSVLDHLLEEKYWTRSTGGKMVGGVGGVGSVGVIEFKTDSSKALGILFRMESCRKHAIDCAKLVLPPRTAEAVQMLIAQPPGTIVHRTRDDLSVVIEANFNFATLNEVCHPIPPPEPPPCCCLPHCSSTSLIAHSLFAVRNSSMLH